INAVRSVRPRVQPVRGGAFRDRLGVVALDLLERNVRLVLEPRARKVPAQIRVDAPQRVRAVLAHAARCVLRLAQQALAEPEREALLADAGRALQQQARRQGAAGGLIAEAFAQRVVTDEWKKRHGEGKDMRYLRRMRSRLLALVPLAACASLALAQSPRVRARDLGVAPGIFKTGAINAITAVAGVRVGQVTLNEGDRVRTGITVIFPHAGNAFLERVPAAVFVGNGFGKLAGSTQVNELGEIETPILLTCTLCVWKAADAMVEWMLAQPGMARVRSINPLVAETNDGTLNDIRARPVTAESVRHALESASGGAVAEGSVGAGTGTVAFGWKGGIGTSSRVLPASLGGYTVGVLVQTNFGGVLQVLGAPVGTTLGHYAFEGNVSPERGDGSCIVVI